MTGRRSVSDNLSTGVFMQLRVLEDQEERPSFYTPVSPTGFSVSTTDDPHPYPYHFPRLPYTCLVAGVNDLYECFRMTTLIIYTFGDK